MRACILTRPDLFPPHHGAAVKILRTAEALSRAGVPVAVVTDDRDRYLRFVDGRMEEVPYAPRARAAQEWPPIPRLGLLAERIVRAIGYPEEEVFLYRPMLDPAWWVRALDAARRERAVVLQAEFPGYGVPAAVVARLAGLLRRLRPEVGGAPPPRSLVVEHNVEFDRLAEMGHDVRGVRRAELAVLRAVDHVVAVSEDDRRRLVGAGLAPDRVSVVPLGVDHARLARARPGDLRRRLGIPADAPLLFFHGTLDYRPNADAVAFIVRDLLPRLLPRVPDLRVVVAGRHAPAYWSHPAVSFPGPVDDLPECIAAADLCLCPIESGGGVRMKLLEYMAAGRAVVSTTKGAEGLPARDGVEIVIADGPDAFAEAVLRLLADPAERARLGAAARRFAARYDWAEIARRTIDLYARWFPRPARARPAAAPRPARAAAPRPAPEPALPPLTMLLLLNRGCNLRCAFCDLWRGREDADVDRLLPVLDDAVALGTRVLVVTGGEPLLHPELFRVVREARARGLSVNVTTNGLLVGRRWAELEADPPDSVSVSVDGLEATHDRLRGRPGAWRGAWEAVDRLVAAGVPTSVYFTATRDNVRELVAVARMAAERGAGFDFWPVNGVPELYLRTEEDRRAWTEAVDALAAERPEVAARRAYLEAALDYHAGRIGRVRCLAFRAQFGVRHDGALLPCCVWGAEELVAGNVFERPLAELWNSPAVRALREGIERVGCAAGCFNHSLHDYERATGRPFRLDAGAARPGPGSP